MFKCSECQKIYDIRPDYCDDCGNDTFEEIVETPPLKKQEIKKEKVKEEVVFKKQEEIPIKPKQNKPEIKFDYPSLGFLGICILISLFIIFFAWNSKIQEKINVKPEDVKNELNSNIPSSVSGFWNNQLPRAEQKQTVVQKPQVVQPQPEIQKPKIQQVAKTPSQVSTAPTKVIAQAPKQTSTAPKQVQKTQQIKNNTPQKPSNIQQTAVKKQVQPAKTTAQTAQVPVQQPKSAPQKPIQTVQPTQNTTGTVQQPVVVKPSVDTSALKKEFANYKISLRNAIGKKIDFANVIGDGACTVSFKIDSSGRLISRAFANQSSNTTLNNAVYSAVMATPSYNPPPAGYKNETLYLKINFYNGNFQITLN